MTILSETKLNYKTFLGDWRSVLRAQLSKVNSEEIFLESYRRLTSLQAWRTCLLEAKLSEPALGFFLEAQNDALISHIHSSCGAWRSALKSLRSCMENSLLTLYYKDHPVELTQWQSGQYRISFSELIKYFEKHPSLRKISPGITGIGLLIQEYDKLSKAVHGSAQDFRMTSDGKAIALWHADKAHLNKWRTHEKRTLQAVNCIMLCLYRDELEGTKQSNLRRTLAFAIDKSKDAKIKSELSVNIKRA